MDFAMSMSNPEDVPIDDIYMHVFAEMIKNTNKPLISIFLSDDHTMEHFREAHFHPRLLDRFRYDYWKDAGAGNLYDRCNAEAKKILSNHVVEPKPDGVLGEIENILVPPRKIMAG